MSRSDDRKPQVPGVVAGADALDGSFTEAGAWREVGSGWQPLFGRSCEDGFSVEWHDFFARRDLDWAASFHPNNVELCFNLQGHGYVAGRGGRRADFGPRTGGFYHQSGEGLTARRAAGERHQFLTVEFSCPFLARQLAGAESQLHAATRETLQGCPCQHVSGSLVRLTNQQLQAIEHLRHPPVHAAAQPLWYQCKALELAVMLLFEASEREFFCSRQQRLAQERVEQVIFLLRQNLASPPPLDELGRRIGCSPFYLSRIFSANTGHTIPQYLRGLRMEKAAELLRSREYNVTEAALEVGYSSLSHFSQAFHETFGCCPGLYPWKAKA